LQELFLVNRAVKEALKLKIPEEVALIFSCKEVILEVLCEVSYDLLECERVLLEESSDRAMEEFEISMISIKQPVKDLAVLLTERCSVKFVVSNGLRLFLGIWCRTLTIKVIWVSQDHVKPERRLNFLHYMSEVHGRNALNRLLICGEGLEEAHNTLRDTSLLALLMNICALRIEKDDFSIGILFFFRLGRLGLQGRIDQKERSNLDAANDIR
jgi:hypothetical protein